MRIGHGYDVHRYKEGRKFVLCGIEIPSEFGPDGHSDADVAVHALMDALLGAAALGDIGRHFPDTDSRYKDISSMKLLEDVVNKISDLGYKTVNVDITVIAQKPKLAKYIDAMRENIATALKIPLNCVNVKATTEEGLGFTGELLGISSHAVVLID